MEVVIRDSNKYGRLTENRLAKLEAELGSRLPEDYRAFMLQHNGGRPQPKRFTFFNEGTEEDDESTVECFFPIHDNRSCKTHLGQPLGPFLKDYRRRHPNRDLLPIGRDPHGGVICLGLTGLKAGWVFFHDHGGWAYSPLAVSFTEFLRHLTPAEEGTLQCRDIPDLDVLHLAARHERGEGEPVLDALTSKYGDFQVCVRKIYMLTDRDLLTFGIGPSSAQLTRKGWAVLKKKPPS